jgi:hypothetical protein
MFVKNGRVVLPDGMSYAVLVLPATEEMTPESLQKVERLVNDGATVVGPKRPQRSPSLSGYPACDEEVRRLGQELWEASGQNANQVLDIKSLKRIFAIKAVEPDFEQMGRIEGNPLGWIHRRAAGTEIYFVANSNAQPASVKCAFRVKGLAPELWLPDIGEIRRPAQWKHNGTRTILPLDLDAFGSVFVAFRNGSEEAKAVAEVSRNGKLLETNLPPPLELRGAWEVEFGTAKTSGVSQRDGNKRIRFERLMSWTDRKEPDVKYFSGTARYLKTFEIPAGYVEERRKTLLDLGNVQVVASVKLNGMELGTAWKPPFRVETTKALRTGTNDLELEVVNLWANRLIGDGQLPDDCEWKPNTGSGCGLLKWPEWLPNGVQSPKSKVQSRPSGRLTFSTWKYFRKDSPLLESGLLGPVRIIATETLKE